MLRMSLMWIPLLLKGEAQTMGLRCQSIERVEHLLNRLIIPFLTLKLFGPLLRTLRDILLEYGLLGVWCQRRRKIDFGRNFSKNSHGEMKIHLQYIVREKFHAQGDILICLRQQGSKLCKLLELQI